MRTTWKSWKRRTIRGSSAASSIRSSNRSRSSRTRYLRLLLGRHWTINCRNRGRRRTLQPPRLSPPRRHCARHHNLRRNHWGRERTTFPAAALGHLKDAQVASEKTQVSGERSLARNSFFDYEI